MSNQTHRWVRVHVVCRHIDDALESLDDVPGAVLGIDIRDRYVLWTYADAGASLAEPYIVFRRKMKTLMLRLRAAELRRGG